MPDNTANRGADWNIFIVRGRAVSLRKTDELSCLTTHCRRTIEFFRRQKRYSDFAIVKKKIFHMGFGRKAAETPDFYPSETMRGGKTPGLMSATCAPACVPGGASDGLLLAVALPPPWGDGGVGEAARG